MYLPFSEFATLQPSKFDVIVIDPPMSSSFSWDTLQELPLTSLAADPSFVFLWVGSGAGDGLERGREVLAKWGYRRCEDVCWVKTNRQSNRGPGVIYFLPSLNELTDNTYTTLRQTRRRLLSSRAQNNIV
jgi:mRNA (2'-O-methyladenosine-N6-)-methyltransferase